MATNKKNNSPVTLASLGAIKNNTWYAIPVFILRQGKGKVK